MMYSNGLLFTAAQFHDPIEKECAAPAAMLPAASTCAGATRSVSGAMLVGTLYRTVTEAGPVDQLRVMTPCEVTISVSHTRTLDNAGQYDPRKKEQDACSGKDALTSK
jgi:hypothetical protein